MDNNKVILDDFHVGNLIISFLKKSNIPQARLAKELGMATPNVNRLLKRESMDTTLLFKISKILNHNFFAEISGEIDEDKSFILIHVHIGNRIETRLKELKMTQTQLATILDVTPAEVSRLIKKDSFDAQKLLKISRLLNYNFFQDYYKSDHLYEGNHVDELTVILKRNEELVAENTRLKDYLKEVYSKMQEFKENNGISIDNWDSLVKTEGVDVMKMATFFFIEENIKKMLDESDQADSSNKQEKDK